MPASVITLWSHLPIVHGFTGRWGFLTEMKSGLVEPARLRDSDLLLYSCSALTGHNVGLELKEG